MSFVEATRMEKARSAVAVAGLHLLLAFALITGLGLDLAGGVSETLKAFNVAPPPPPPVEDEPAPEHREPAAREEAQAAPPAPTAEPPPIVAPQPEIEQDVPPPVAAGLVPASGTASSAGAADAGSGSGAGGQGTGIGGGGSGAGSGGGGRGSRAVLNSGEIVRSDYPRAAVETRAEGRVEVRFIVGTDGRVRSCRVARSSGSAALDQTTCRLVEARFRWTPARDAQGNLIAEERGWQQTWWFDRRQRTTRRRIDPPDGKARAEPQGNQVRDVVD